MTHSADLPNSARDLPAVPFLRMPPFPRAKVTSISSVGEGPPLDAAIAEQLTGEIVSARVGGNFWGAQPSLPVGRDILAVPTSSAQAAEMAASAAQQGLADRLLFAGGHRAPGDYPWLKGIIDPWHIVDQAAAVWADANDEMALIAALTATPLTTFGHGKFFGLGEGNHPVHSLAEMMANDILGRTQFRDPFSGGASDAAAAIGLLGDWRRLIDSNRPTRAIFGVAGWKRPTVDALLWNGSAPPPYGPSHVTGRRGLGKGDAALLWKSRVAKTLEPDLARRGVRIGEIEDGFIRSSGLGANCVPPLSIAVDYCGAHFDPAQPSDLELILQNADIDPAMIARAAALRERLVATGISKYGHDAQPFAKAGGARRHVLVTGQVEDDRSVLTGGGGISNLDLLRQARALEPDAYLIYKPHPDVEAGHRKGRIADSDALALADQVERHAPIAGILASVDAIHVITSLAGFEGLMRGKQVVAHGTPFFAGWGLTTDLGSVPARRTRRRTLDELVAATLILYPRYLDPVSGLPCPVETLVDRMAVGETATITPLVRLRQWQGKVNVFFRAWGHGHDQAK